MRISTRPVDLDADIGMLHGWVSGERARFWGLVGADEAAVRAEHEEIAASDHHHARIGLVDDEPAFLLETYDPTRHEMAALADVSGRDLGMHFLVAPPTTPVPGFTLAVITGVLEHCFADPDVDRVVVEPDVRNTKVHALNEAVGFRPEREIELHDKTALLSFCTREDFLGRNA